MSNTRKKYKDEARAEILRSAREIFVHEGYSSFTLRGLSQRIGCAPSAVYRHFKNKREIFDCLIAESIAVLFRSHEDVKRREGESSLDRLKRNMWSYVTFGVENPGHYRFAFLVEKGSTKPASKPSAVFGVLQEQVQDCINDGTFRSGDALLMSQAIWAALHGITALLIQRSDFPWSSRRRLIGCVIDSAIIGLLSLDFLKKHIEGEVP